MGGVHVYVFSRSENLRLCLSNLLLRWPWGVFPLLFSSNIMNNFAFKAIFTFVLHHVQSRLNGE